MGENTGLKTITRADRYACKECPFKWDSGSLEVYPYDLTGKRLVNRYTYYCTKYGRLKKIAAIYDFTGLVPKWCPRLAENLKPYEQL